MVITNARLTTSSPYQKQNASGLAIQPDLKTVISGVAAETYQTGPGKNSTATVWDIVVARYNTDGSLDTTFGSGGLVRIRTTSMSVSGPQLVLQPDGKIVVAGDTHVTYSTGKKTSVVRRDLYVLRLNPDGSLDTTFNGTGSKIVDFPQGEVNEEGVALQPDGKIVLGGDSTAAGLHFLAVRLNPNGTLDTSFANGRGYVGISSGTAQGITLDGSGNVILYGYESDPLGNLTGAIVRYTPAGIPDSTFGNGGEVVPSSIGPAAFVTGTATAADQILVGGDFPDGGGVARINADGSVDTTFGTNGVFTETALFHPDGIAVQSDGKVLLAGKGPHGGSPFGYLVDRLSPSGQPDPTFGVNGQARAFFSGLPDAQPDALAIGPDGKITITGYADDPSTPAINFQIATARFLNDTVGAARTAAPAASVVASPVPPPGAVIVAAPSDGPDVLTLLGKRRRRD
jgi:uncharacterized delta-60 repeat protein